MTLNELLLEWSYRSERGYPSLGSPSDISILKEILLELNLSEQEVEDVLDNLPNDKKTYANKDGKVGKTTGLEDSDFEDISTDDNKNDIKIDTPQDQEIEDKTDDNDDKSISGDEEYDAVIRTHLGLSDDQPIPRVKGKYSWPGKGGATFNIQVKDADLKYWQDFWELTPPKAGEEIGTLSKGSGNGEISLYWLYQHSNTANVIGTQGSDNPDLEFDGVGVEVKAFGAKTAHASAKGLGRWSSDKPQLDALGILFGFQKLVMTLEPKSSGKLPRDISPNNFHAHQLIPAFQQLNKLLAIDLETLGEEYSIFLDIAKRLDDLKSKIGE